MCIFTKNFRSSSNLNAPPLAKFSFIVDFKTNTIAAAVSNEYNEELRIKITADFMPKTYLATLMPGQDDLFNWDIDFNQAKGLIKKQMH
ncbi:hypothetical protein BGW38_007689, partial [Lunasporangiospora selenospora]